MLMRFIVLVASLAWDDIEGQVDFFVAHVLDPGNPCNLSPKLPLHCALQALIPVFKPCTQALNLRARSPEP